MLANFKESAQGIAAIAALAAVFWGVRLHSLAELTASSDDGSAASGVSEFRQAHVASTATPKRLAGPRRPSIPTQARNLPACEDLADALRLLQAARTQRQQTSSRTDADAAEAAQAQYGYAVSQVRVELSKLYGLIEPDQYAILCGEVIGETLPDDTSRLSAWELVSSGEGMSL
jgi:hypothetical protein